MSLTHDEKSIQTEQTIRAYLLGLDRVAGVKLNEFQEDFITRNSLADHAKHVKRHKINQKNIDAYKLIGFLAYHTCKSVWDSGVDDQIQIPLICRHAVDRLCAPLKKDTQSRVVLKSKDKQYISSMLEAEICNNGDSGIGANGIGAVFQYMRKAFNYTDKWDAETAEI